MNTQQEADFLTILYQLKKSFEDSTFFLQRSLDEKNIDMLLLANTNSLDPKDRAVQLKVQDAFMTETRKNLFHMALNVTKHLLLSHQKFETSSENLSVHLETLLWILQRLESIYDLEQFRASIVNGYGESRLVELERFNNINPPSLEKEAQPQTQEGYLEEYARNIQEMLLPWFEMKPVNLHKAKSEPKPQILNDFPISQRLLNNSTNNSSKWKVVERQDIQPKFNEIKKKSNYKENIPVETTTKKSLLDMKLSAKGAAYLRTPTVTSAILRPDEECLINSSSNFDFNQMNKNLKISLIKGLCKKNVEFYDQLEAQLIKQGVLFEDRSFGPVTSSLTTNVVEFPRAEEITWKRLSEVYKNEAMKVCSDDIGPNDIKQGHLGDCYLLSALSVLAEQRKFIKRLFHSKHVSPVGCYSIWLCDSGEWKNIIIDDYIPCIESEEAEEEGEKKIVPSFSKNKSNDIWVVLLEKAFAKLFGNYHNIDGGCLSEAMSVLTGAPTKFFKEKKGCGKSLVNQLWEFIDHNLKNNFPVTAATRGESLLLNITAKTNHIVSDHAYAVLDIKEVDIVTDSSSNIKNKSTAKSLKISENSSSSSSSSGNSSEEGKRKERLIKMRNPWGMDLLGSETWGKRSEYWTSRVYQEGKKMEEEGTFWISLEDFASHFKFVCACEIHEDYYFSFIKLGEQKGLNYYVAKMEIDTPAFVYLTVHQKLKKHFRRNDNYNYSFGRVLIGQLDKAGKIVSVVDGKYKGSQNILIKEKFNKGEYIILIEMDWVQRFYNEIVVTSYAKVNVSFQEEPAHKYDLNSLYLGFLRAMVKSAPEETFLAKQYELDNQKYQIWKYKVEKFGLVGLLYLNKEKDIVLNTKLDIQNLENMVLANTQGRDGQFIELKVKPGALKMVLLKTKVDHVLEGKDQEKNDKMSKYEYSELFRLSNVFTEDELKALCKEKGAIVNELKEGKIVVYRFKYLGGLAEYYVNMDERVTFIQDIQFEVKNVLVNEAEPKDMKIVVEPGSHFLLNMRVKDFSRGSKFNRKSTFILSS